MTGDFEPCPFCGDDQSLEVSEIGEETRFSQTEYAVICGNCGAAGPPSGKHVRAPILWNARYEAPDE